MGMVIKFHDSEDNMSAEVHEGNKPGLFNVVLVDDDSDIRIPACYVGLNYASAVGKAKFLVNIKEVPSD